VRRPGLPPWRLVAAAALIGLGLGLLVAALYPWGSTRVDPDPSAAPGPWSTARPTGTAFPAPTPARIPDPPHPKIIGPRSVMEGPAPAEAITPAPAEGLPSPRWIGGPGFPPEVHEGDVTTLPVEEPGVGDG
jgi:hypothetical protein